MNNSNRKWARLIACVMFVNYFLTAGLVTATHNGGVPVIFELDGNAGAVGSELGTNDWANVLLGTGGDSLVHLGPVSDPANAPLIFSGGGSKDINDLNQWKFATRDGGPDKDALTNAYAATYTDTRLGSSSYGHQILYFGADRFDNSGNAQLGFWFFRAAVGLGPKGTFTGNHTAGATPDILVLSDFINGGAQSVIQVFEWVGSGGSHGSLNLLVEKTSNGLVVCSDDDSACAVANGASTPSPWPYVPKSGPANIFPPVSFIEGGIDLTALGLEGCISSFLAETRSSQSETAVLKDFILGQTFNTCGISATKSCTVTVNPSGTAATVNFSGQICNSGPLTVTGLSATDSTGATVNLTSTTLDPAGLPGDCVGFNGSYSSTTLTNSDTVTVTGSAGGTSVSATADATCSTSTSPVITVSKSCTAAVNTAGTGVEVAFSGNVCNTGNVAVTNITVNDNKPTNPTLVKTIGSLAPGACDSYTGSYTSATASNSDTITASGTGALGSGAVSATGDATCTAAINSGLTVSKTCETDLQLVNNLVAVKVNFGGQICNTGNTQVTGLSLVNDKPGPGNTTVLSGITLAPNTCLPYSSSYTPTNISTGNLLSPSSAIFKDTVNVSGTAALVGSVNATSGEVSCPLCQ